MAATETRLLVLGAVRLFEPVNGYQVRRELMSWGVDEWAHLLPGSVYSVLGTLTRQGHLERHDLAEGARCVAVYTTTDEGRAELMRLFERALTTVDPLEPLPAHTAISLAPLFPRGVVADHLETRAKAVADRVGALEEKLVATREGGSPPHVERVLELQIGQARLEQQWLDDVVVAVRRGELWFTDEPMTWQLADDDPGRQMSMDRLRYLAALGRGEG